MRVLLLISFFTIVLVSCTQQETKKNQEDDKPKMNETISGIEIFQQNCVSCHGAVGNLGTSGAKNLQTSKLTKSEIVLQVTNGKGMMSAYKNLLSEEEIEHVSEYVLTLRK